MNSTEERLVHLERQNRIQKWLICGLTLVFVMGLGPQVQDRLRVRSMTVVNDEGKVCAMISGEKEGGILSLYDVSSKEFGPGLNLETDRNGGRVELFDGTNKPQTEITSGDLLIRTEDGVDVANIGADRGRGGAVVLSNEKGREQMRMTAMMDGAILRMFGSPKGRGWPFNAYVSDDSGFLFVADKDGNTTGQLPAKK